MSEFIAGVDKKYDKRLLVNRVKTEAAVIGCIYKDPMLLDDSGIKREMFITTDGRYYIELAFKLRQNKINVFDEISILTTIDDKILVGFQERGGYEQI